MMGRMGWKYLIGAGLVWAAMHEVALGQAAGASTLRRFEFTQIEMAVTVRVILYSADEQAATAAAKAAFGRIHDLNGILSDYDPESELRRLCNIAGQHRAVPVSSDLWKVLEHAQHVAELSGGAFDETVGPVVRLWRRARRQKELPSAEVLKKARELVGYKYVRLDPKQKTVQLLKSGMQIDLGGIAKGYAMDEALAVLQKKASIGRWWRPAATCALAIHRRAAPDGGSASCL